MNSGSLFVRNKALGGGRTTAKLTQRIKTKRHLTKTTSTESAKILEQITEVWELDHVFILMHDFYVSTWEQKFLQTELDTLFNVFGIFTFMFILKQLQ